MATTTPPFAQAIADMVSAVLPMLANVSATIDGGVPVQGLFTDAYTSADIGPYGMASSAPTLTLASADTPDSPVGKAVTVNDTNYMVRATEPDGSGLTRLILERAA
ncbi:MAG: hypothetical protein JZU64_15500 [Rhodoferax sp.]|nr:hypothetical protein [Rhodoferax sp.]